MLEGLMQDFPLTVQHLRRRMRDCHPHAEVATLTPDGVVRASFGEISGRVDRLARVLGRLGVERGDRVGTFAWNNQRHFELYMAVPCAGAVLHTLNIRLFSEQLKYIVAHAEDQVIFVDDSLVGVLEPLASAPELSGVRHYVVMGDGDPGSLPNALRYEELLEEAGEGPFDYPEVDEREAAALCYTSGTTGNPKGVLYSHRSVSLHSTACLMSDALALSRRDKALVVVPMFHANAWGIPHAAALCGAELVMPDRFLQAEALGKLIEQERPSIMGCVPTIFADLLRYADTHEVDLSSLTNAACGGSAVPLQLIKDFQERHAVRIFQAWGMTETSPVATYARPLPGPDGEEKWEQRAKQGPPLPWVELRLAGDREGGATGEGGLAGEGGATGEGRLAGEGGATGEGGHAGEGGATGEGGHAGEVDVAGGGQGGRSTGEIEVRGPWVAASYYNDASNEEKFDAGWLRTGDIASLDGEGFVQITDRAKDVIKSGGEWISSVELENAVMAHPGVLEAAVIAKPDEKWSERPLCCVVAREGSQLTAEDLLQHLRPLVATWWLPDEFAFIEEVPKTSVGKLDKKALRAQLDAGTLPGRVAVPLHPASAPRT